MKYALRNLCLTAAALLVFATAVTAQEEPPQFPIDRPEKFGCFAPPAVPWLIDYNTYIWYEPIDNVSESVDQVNGGWVQGRVYLQSSGSFVGIVDNNTVTYVEPFEGTTPIDGGHAFNAGWGVLVTVNGWDGLIVMSPFGSWVQHEPYDGDEVAVVRITNRNGRLIYSLNGVAVFSQAAPDVGERDLRAFYFGPVDNALVGVCQ